MKEKTKGFTLIELLVVVLIIGILAAAALPQYQKAVDKSRFAKYIQVGMGIKRVQEAYYLANGEYAEDLQALDIDYTNGCKPYTIYSHMWSCPDGYFIDFMKDPDPTGLLMITFCPDYKQTDQNYIPCYQDYREARYSIYMDHADSVAHRGKAYCSGVTSRGKAVCKALAS